MNDDQLLAILRQRFEANTHRHPNLRWSLVQARLEADVDKLRRLWAMEQTGGEPDVVAGDAKTGELTFIDCSAESPGGRRSLCYDRKALDKRKENKPRDDAVGMAASMGVELLNEEQYRALQALGDFDRKTSSWITTPADIREKGGALFCDRRYDHVFVYHNGADAYYAARGFRALLKV